MKQEIKKQQLEIAKEKAKKLTPHTQIRVSADVQSYTVYNVLGKIFIGWDKTTGVKQMFKNKPVLVMTDKDGKAVAELQAL